MKSSVKQKIGDSVTVAAIIIAILFSIPLVTKGADAGKPAFAVVEVNGRESLRVALGEDGRDRTFDVEGSAGTSTIEVKNGRVRMLESDCPDKLCIGMGWAEKTGDSIVCIPNRVVIELVGPEKIKEVDTVTE
ncbi:MAG: NusG domain II-containing protein [Actinobacteria bacterium]|nr:NusG domain II-containing protein [Actinomycetota bacterium]